MMREGVKVGHNTLVILGAGASWPLPMTQELTDRLLARPDTTMGYKLYEAIRETVPGVNTFEDIMAALQDAAMATQRRKQPPWWTSLESRLPAGLGVGAACTRGLIDAAHYIAIAVTRPAPDGPAEPYQAAICRELPSEGRRFVATLNYDDTVLAGPNAYYDGFAHGAGGSSFDDQFSKKVCCESEVLLWLHGSTHFNINSEVDNQPNRQFGRVFWDDDSVAVVSGWAGAVRNEMFDLPLVIGADKPRQILRRPFINYWAALSDFAGNVDRLVVIGYSGGDEHLNHILQNIVMWGGDDLKVVIGTRAASWDDVKSTLCKIFPSLFNVYGLANCEPASPGGSLQRVLPSLLVTIPEVWVDLDGVQDLATPTAVSKLKEVLQ